jgi:signal transduction histidine kinase
VSEALTAGAHPADRRRLRRVGFLIAAACLVPALLDGWQSYLQARLAGAAVVPWRDIAFQSGEWVILGALTPLVYTLAVRFPPRGPDLARNLAVHLAGALALCVGWAGLGIGLRAGLGILPPHVTLSRLTAGWMLTSLPWSVFMYFTVLGCVLAFAYFMEATEREALNARLAAQVAEARLGALQMQLRPHFLFNSLNAVAVLVRDGRGEDATRAVETLSDMLRQTLGEAGPGEVPLADEIAFLEKYLAIEGLRFPDRLHVRWSVAPAARQALVPGFVLQPLVENALRHGVAARSAPSTVEITARLEGPELVLEVGNDAPDEQARADTRGRGLGLANTRERLATLYGDAARLSLGEAGGRVTATVRLPYRRAAS